MTQTTMHAPLSTNQEISSVQGTRQFLTFAIGEEHYGVDILKVQEIKGFTTVTQIPHLPDYFKGIMNLRGTIIPIVDLRLKFGMGPTTITSFTVVIVVNIGDRITGILVDAVSDVLDLDLQSIHTPPELGQRIDVNFMEGIATYQEGLVTLLNLNHALSEEELAQACQTPEALEQAPSLSTPTD